MMFLMKKKQNVIINDGYLWLVDWKTDYNEWKMLEEWMKKKWVQVPKNNIETIQVDQVWTV